MRQTIENALDELSSHGTLRSLPSDLPEGCVDLSSNDYLGIAQRSDLQAEFLSTLSQKQAFVMSASASRLLASSQSPFVAFEHTLAEAYGKEALLFNSGYHANTGIVSAFAGTRTYILADKLVHASIIDGIRLSGLPYARFRHNDISHLMRLASKAYGEGYKLLIIAESIYSMDGDRADIEALADVRNRFPGSMLYIDEAHAVGVCGPSGLGLCFGSPRFNDIDIVVGTMGKALASAGAYAMADSTIRTYLINRARSLIFSTALAPVNALWSEYIFRKSMSMDAERRHLASLATTMAAELASLGISGEASHIQTVICGDPRRAVSLSQALHTEGFNVLPIRTPTVPPGTDRLRISLSASLSADDVAKFTQTLKKIYTNAQAQK